MSGGAAPAASPLMPTYPPPPVTFVRGEGSRLWDDAGNEYLDLLSGLAVTGLGHSHPAVADALATQARTLLHTSNLFGTVPGPEVARTLDRLLGGGPHGDGEQGRHGGRAPDDDVHGRLGPVLPRQRPGGQEDQHDRTGVRDDIGDGAADDGHHSHPPGLDRRETKAVVDSAGADPAWTNRPDHPAAAISGIVSAV